MHYKIKHPVLEHKLTILRDKNTGSKEFRELINEITMFAAYDALKNIDIDNIDIETPMCKTVGKIITNDIVLVPILRAGVGMLEGCLRLIPNAKVGFIGLYRDHDTKKPVEYYNKLPDNLNNPIFFIIDPMLATGGSIIATIDILKKAGHENIKIISVISAPEGIEKVETSHPDVDIYTASIDEKLDDNQYIIPGLGDAGDRLFGTK